MAVLKLIGAKRFMNKRASPNVIELGGLTDDIQDEKLIKALMDWRRVDADNKEYPMFEPYSGADNDNKDMNMDMDVSDGASDPEPSAEIADTKEKEPKAEKPKAAVKKKAARKKGVRTRSRSKATDV